MVNVNSRSLGCPTALLEATGAVGVGASFVTGSLFSAGIITTPVLPITFGAYGIVSIGTSLMVRHIGWARNTHASREQVVATVEGQVNPAIELEAGVNVTVNTGEEVAIDVDVGNGQNDSSRSSTPETRL